MKCDEAKAILDENLTATGFTDHTKRLTDLFDPLKDITLTDTESAVLEGRLHHAVDEADSLDAPYSRKNKISSITRLVFSAAAALVIMLISFNNDPPAQLAINQRFNEIQLTQLSDNEILQLLMNGDADLLPSIVDQNSASYLTDQISPGQAEDIFETATTEELEWLLSNFNLEI
jgi:hypothetical protein